MIMCKPLEVGTHPGKEWCGPSNLSILTGRPLNETTATFARISGEKYKDVAGTYASDVLLALYEYGLRGTPMDLAARYPDVECGVTPQRFVGDLTPTERFNPIWAGSSAHWFIFHMGMFFDNSTGGKPLDVRLAKRFVIGEAYIIEKI